MVQKNAREIGVKDRDEARHSTWVFSVNVIKYTSICFYNNNNNNTAPVLIIYWLLVNTERD